MKNFVILAILFLTACATTYPEGTPVDNTPTADQMDFNKGLAAYLDQDYETALEHFQPLAEQGVMSAQHNLALMYHQGRGVPQDDAEAVKWYGLAAAQGKAESQNNLGYMYQNGRGTDRDDKAAAEWYKLAAEQGMADAQYNLGILYLQGKGIVHDYAHVHMWWDMAASQGHEKATKNLEMIENVMSDSELAKAMDLTLECMNKDYKGC